MTPASGAHSQPLCPGRCALMALEWLLVRLCAWGLTSVAHRPQVPEIVSMLRTKLQETREEYVLQAAQHSVYLLASQHCAAVVSSLLGSPLPFDRYVHLPACCGGSKPRISPDTGLEGPACR